MSRMLTRFRIVSVASPRVRPLRYPAPEPSNSPLPGVIGGWMPEPDGVARRRGELPRLRTYRSGPTRPGPCPILPKQPAMVTPSDKITTKEHPGSTHVPETITSRSASGKKPQVSGQVSGRAPGTRTQNLWIKSPRNYENPLLDALPRPVSQYHYVPFGPRSPFPSQPVDPMPYRMLPGRAATYEQTTSKRWGPPAAIGRDGSVRSPALESTLFTSWTTSVNATGVGGVLYGRGRRRNSGGLCW
jgi:hypothetical protein